MDTIIGFFKNLLTEEEDEEFLKETDQADPFAWPYKVDSSKDPSKFESDFPKILEGDESDKHEVNQIIIKSLAAGNNKPFATGTSEPVTSVIGAIENKTSLTKVELESNKALGDLVRQFHNVDSTNSSSSTDVIKTIVDAPSNPVKTPSSILEDLFNRHKAHYAASAPPDQTSLSPNTSFAGNINSENSPIKKSQIKSIFENVSRKIGEVANKKTVQRVTEEPLFENLKTTLDNEETKSTAYGLDTAVNVDAINIPFRPTSTETSSAQDIFENFMRTTRVDPSVIQPIHNPQQYTTEPFGSGLNMRPRLKTELPIFETPIRINKTLNNIFNSTTQESISTTILEKDISNATGSLADITTKVSNITYEITSSNFTNPNITTTDSAINNFNTTANNIVEKITSKMKNVTIEKSEDITYALKNFTDDVVASANNFTNEITTESSNITTAIDEVINVTENITTTTQIILDNITGVANIEPVEKTNTWVFYVIVFVTIVVLLLVIGLVFLFYKKVKGPYVSGYQVSQMKEYKKSSKAANLNVGTVEL